MLFNPAMALTRQTKLYPLLADFVRFSLKRSTVLLTILPGLAHPEILGKIRLCGQKFSESL